MVDVIVLLFLVTCLVMFIVLTLHAVTVFTLTLWLHLITSVGDTVKDDDGDGSMEIGVMSVWNLLKQFVY